jgi:hypothetical protein
MPTWTTKSGKKIKVENMTDNHILYALRLCMRVLVQLNEILDLREIYPLFDEEFDRLLNVATLLTPWISIFDKEIVKRELTPLPIDDGKGDDEIKNWF